MQDSDISAVDIVRVTEQGTTPVPCWCRLWATV